MLPLPSIKPFYTPDEVQSLATNPAAKLALYYGVDKKFLKFTDPSYVEDINEQYEMHNFSTFSVVCVGGEKEEVTAKVQAQKAVELINDGGLWAPSLILINSPSYFFHGADSSIEGPDGLLAHFICSLCHRIVTRKAPPVEINFLETMQLDHARGYQFKPKHLCIWGPLTENSSQYDFNKTTQFLFSFRHYARILLLSVRDIGAFLEKFNTSLSAVDFVFNLATDLPKKGEIKYAKPAKKRAKAKSTIGI